MEESLPLNWWHLGIGVVVLAAVAALADWLKSRVVAKAIGRVASEARISLDDGPFDRMVLGRLAPIVPALVVYYGIVPALGVTRAEAEAGTEAELLILFWTLVRRLSAAYITLIIARTLTAVLDSFSAVYHRTSPASVARPVKSYMQVATLVIYLVGGAVIIAILLGRSPVIFLSGVGAAAAVLMLVFRNTLLSLAASIQITSNDIIRIGDWVELPYAGTDGTVIDIDLHMVRVQNWDKTVSTIPTHRFISEAFKNWRGMSESGGRRIKRAILIDVHSIRFLAAEEIRELTRSETMGRHLRPPVGNAAAGKAGQGADDGPPRRLTNLEAFLSYVEGYVRAHAGTHQEMTLMVRQLAPGPHGVPIEVYCFSKETEWVAYEAFQSGVFNHLFGVLPEFGLRAFQERSGSDLPRRENLVRRTLGGPVPNPGSTPAPTGSPDTAGVD